MKAILERFAKQEHPSKQTLGTLFLYKESQLIFSCKTLELPDLENRNQVSRIPEGTYKVIRRTSKRYGEHFHITNVPGREYILIHPGNYFTQIRGCVLVGKDHQDINKDGVKDVTSSRVTMNDLLSYGLKGFELEIKDCNE